MVAASVMSRASWYALGGGTALLSIAWIYLMLSRRGATRPVSKCVVLSVGAHLILLGLANLTNWFPTPLGSPLGTGDIHVRWFDDPFATDGTSTADATLAETPHDPDPISLPEPDDLPFDSSHPDVEPLEVAADALPPPDNPAPPLLVTATANAKSSAQEVARDESSDALPRITETDADAEFVLSATDSGNTADGAPVPEPPPPPPPPIEHHSAEPVLAEFPPSSVSLPSPSAPLPDRYAGRTTENRRRLAAARGGSNETEAAVEAGLAWLARAQNPSDGRWDNRAWEGGRETRDLGGITHGVKADTAVTGLALLAFLGAGHTHQQGPYQENVRRGLQFLMHSQSPQTGSLAADSSRYVAMYCHGIATLAMSEAMIMSNDRQLHRPLLRAVDYTVRSQHPVTGGWRYQPGDLGDTSQFGWQLMALVSAEAAGIPIPDSTWNGAQRWLDRVTLGSAGGLACYTPDRPVASASMTAEALFCRTFMRRFPAQVTIDEASEYVARYGASMDARNDLYFCYYATLALYQFQDHRWQRWNETITRHLVDAQQRRGSLEGSWNCDTRWGPVGGRVYTTSMACLCLETYYRYLPVFELAATRGQAIQRR